MLRFLLHFEIISDMVILYCISIKYMGILIFQIKKEYRTKKGFIYER